MRNGVISLPLSRPELLDPLEHPGWDALLASECATVFHTSGWARVLRETYGHRPFYLAEIREGCARQLLPIMEVSSPVTGRRGVALPFTDVCPVISPSGEETSALFDAAMQLGRERGWRSLECRGNVGSWKGALPSVKFYTHSLDLTPGPDAIFRKFESPMRRAIRKAEQTDLNVEFSAAPEAVETYYHLHCRTRSRHGVPPQPVRFFENIGKFILQAGHGFIAIARNAQIPIAAAVYLRFGREAIYKFGASDLRFQHLRPNNLVMWAAIRKLALEGCASLHMGRTSLANEGLRRFKLSFGAAEQTAEYARYDFRRGAFVETPDRAQTWANHLFRLMPSPLLRLAGRLLYPHLS